MRRHNNAFKSNETGSPAEPRPALCKYHGSPAATALGLPPGRRDSLQHGRTAPTQLWTPNLTTRDWEHAWRRHEAQVMHKLPAYQCNAHDSRQTSRILDPASTQPGIPTFGHDAICLPWAHHRSWSGDRTRANLATCTQDNLGRVAEARAVKRRTRERETCETPSLETLAGEQGNTQPLPYPATMAHPGRLLMSRTLASVR